MLNFNTARYNTSNHFSNIYEKKRAEKTSFKLIMKGKGEKEGELSSNNICRV